MKLKIKKRAVHFIVLAILLTAFTLNAQIAFSHGEVDDEHEGINENIGDEAINIPTNAESKKEWPEPVKYIKFASIWFAVLLLFAVAMGNNLQGKSKKVLFLLMVTPVVLSALYLATHTVYLNLVSVTKGPIHWHADTRTFLCGNEVELVNPEGLSNKVGSSVLHEHNDGRIHVEGVVKDLGDITLGKFFETVGGQLHSNHIMYPTTKGLMSYMDGDICPDGSVGTLKVYVNGKRIGAPEKYVPSPEANVPPGDCIIFDFSSTESETTDKLCMSWETSGWNYENANEMRKTKGRSIELEGKEDDKEHEGYIHMESSQGGTNKLGKATTFGPGDAPHMHSFDLSKFEKVKDIAKNPADIPPPINRDYEEIVIVSLHAKEVISEIAPGITYHYWTYNGTVPGPMIRVREGDIVELTLSNDKTSLHNHSIDLHAVNGPHGGGKDTQVAPGESKTIRFKALNPGEYVYHCATANVPMHMTNGMYGLIVVEPKNGLPKVDKEFYVMQGELYTKGVTGEPGFQGFEPVKMFNEKPDYVVFNGKPKGLVNKPMQARAGDKIRLFFGNGGVALISSFHVIGEIFDKVYIEGASSAADNIQTTTVPAGGSAAVEFKIDVKGNYVVVDHALARLDKGAWAVIKADGQENPEIYAAVR